MTTLIVTLLSDQTIPNVQFVKYIQEKLKNENEQFEHLFVSTSIMEKKGVGQWICKVCNIEHAKTIVVAHNSLEDIGIKLSANIDEYETYYVNITGGTKIMSMAVTDFFRKKPQARIYYIDGSMCWLNYPDSKRFCDTLADNISLQEYVESYGFEKKEHSSSGIDPEYTKSFLQKFLGFGDCDRCIINNLRKHRDKKKLIVSEMSGLQDFLCKIEFPTQNDYLSLTKNEIKYLTGEWFEEYIYFRLNDENVIYEDNIRTGIELKKNEVKNEFDIVFLYKTKFYAIECKTSILSSDKGNIITDTIYKSIALQKNLGLFSNFSIFTLSSKDSNEVGQAHLERAKDLNLKVFCREDIVNCESISKLLDLC